MGKQLLIQIHSIYHSEVGGIRPTYQSTHPHSLINGLLFIIEIHAAKNSGTLFLIQLGLSTSHFYTAHIFQTKYWITEKSLILIIIYYYKPGLPPSYKSGVPFLWSVRLIKHIMKIKSLKDREKAQYEPKALWLWAQQIFSCCISTLSIWTDDIINIK